MTYQVGIDVGSTTIKFVVLNEQREIIYKSYERHKSRVREKAYEKFCELEELLKGVSLQIAISGSGGQGIANIAQFFFVQEVFATTKAVRQFLPQSEVVIELGGEDAKIIFLKGALEERMNSTCAGGTGAFIDQMASLLNVNNEELNELSLKHTKLYPIASRCGVFAKSDIQPLINQGADKSNIAASIFQAVVDQTITGLAQGRKIEGHVTFLGGPLYFNSGLQERFIQTLKLDPSQTSTPELAPYYVALGACLFAQDLTTQFTYEQAKKALYQASISKLSNKGLAPLFANEQQYYEFKERHYKATVKTQDLANYHQKAYLGIDAGSTTTKMVLLSEENEILYSNYTSNQGNPIDVVKDNLLKIYEINPSLKIASSGVTGYGEELIQKAFQMDCGEVETIAHYTAACFFNPQVDFIIDIGGQDMKCFKIKEGHIDEIILNEACSSGCGSFLETFAHSLGYDIQQFAAMGLVAQHPVDLGSRCTVFMNSSVKEAQKNGACIEDISAGLAISVVKNALYKVIRVNDANDLGKEIVVQGGTFLNDTVLRSFELELGKNVIRPSIAGLMGAFGVALIAKQKAKKQSTLMSVEKLKTFTHTSQAINCQGCTNHCNLTINTFDNNQRLIAGNKCERPVTGKQFRNNLPNGYRYKLELLHQLTQHSPSGKHGTLGLPLVLNMYENLPFWHCFFTELGFEVVLSDPSSKALYAKGQQTIPSDTACYPAKLVHGHIASLLEKKVEAIFYPAMTYNFDEGISDNCYNCPVVAYYPENIVSNMDLSSTKFIYPFISLNNPHVFSKKIYEELKKQGYQISRREVAQATKKAYEAYAQYRESISAYTKQAIAYAQKNHIKCICLAGRPYHIDEEINHGIANLLSNLDCVVVSEDGMSEMSHAEKRNVLNQWTYHARLYQAADAVCHIDSCELIQLVSFGCGLDSITSDEIKEILHQHHKLYTQIKIDEIDNLGAAKIRIRSLLAAMSKRGEQNER